MKKIKLKAMRIQMKKNMRMKMNIILMKIGMKMTKKMNLMMKTKRNKTDIFQKWYVYKYRSIVFLIIKDIYFDRINYYYFPLIKQK